MTDELILTNARIVLADEVILGSVKVTDGRIADVGAPFAGGIDLEGDYLLPGLVELHTDHLESHYAPRPGVRWNAVAAVQAHDAQVAASGITTVFDALRVGLKPMTRHVGRGFHQARCRHPLGHGCRAAARRAFHPPPLRSGGARLPRCLGALRGRQAGEARLADGPFARAAAVRLGRGVPELLPEEKEA